MAFWSGNYIAGKIALRAFSPLLLAGLRIAMAGVRDVAALCLGTDAQAGRVPGWTHRTRNLAASASLGIFGVTLNQVFFVVGLSRTSVAHAAILIGLEPLYWC